MSGRAASAASRRSCSSSTTAADRFEEGPARVLEALLDGSGYVAELQAEHSVEAEGRLENLAELLGSAAEFDTVDEFLEQVSLVADTDELDADESSSS